MDQIKSYDISTICKSLFQGRIQGQLSRSGESKNDRALLTLVEMSVGLDVTNSHVFWCYTREYVDQAFIYWLSTFTSHCTHSFTIWLLLIDDVTNTIVRVAFTTVRRLLHEDSTSQLITSCWVFSSNQYSNLWTGTVSVDAKFIVPRNSPVGSEWNWWTSWWVTIYQVFSTGTRNEFHAWWTCSFVLVQSKGTNWKEKWKHSAHLWKTIISVWHVVDEIHKWIKAFKGQSGM